MRSSGIGRHGLPIVADLKILPHDLDARIMALPSKAR